MTDTPPPVVGGVQATYETSDDLNELGAALAKAQGAMKGASKDSVNPFFKSKYADLASVWKACGEHLAANGISVVQMPESQGNQVAVTSMLLHSSGQYITNRLKVTAAKADVQGVGSAITYARRYALAAMVGIYTEDDDGNSAVQGRQQQGRVYQR